MPNIGRLFHTLLFQLGLLHEVHDLDFAEKHGKNYFHSFLYLSAGGRSLTCSDYLSRSVKQERRHPLIVSARPFTCRAAATPKTSACGRCVARATGWRIKCKGSDQRRYVTRINLDGKMLFFTLQIKAKLVPSPARNWRFGRSLGANDSSMVTGLAATSSTSTGIAEQYATTTASDRAIL
ncbi:hypothetical protein DAPPUDRAFT_118128 [Daphnia pulex]|uniref:Uncharacterized protein n=1 Tax=Daphnia pulex TaxID=6669 RepID=E9HUU5_DAPPU|nr:hypothetical protein DAPPUDRAFT_118128 [Daphnia pulex]|eukprot:EFX64490.1 hypothetical protein DAPPUDRAFT_118128 [Daphnia pulex]